MRPPSPVSPSFRAVLAAAVLAALVAAAPSAGAAPTEGPRRASPTPASAAPSAALALAEPSPDLVGLPPTSVDLASVAVDSPGFRRARTTYQRTADVLAAHQAARMQIDNGLADVRARRARVEARRGAALGQAAAARARLDELDAAIADLAAALYASGGATERVDAALASEQPSIHDADRRDVLGAASLDVLLAERAAYAGRLGRARADAKDAERELAALDLDAQRLSNARPSAAAAEAGAQPAVATARVAYEAERALATVEGLEFPLVALSAYYKAATAMASEDPACALRWWAVAGIARVEGHHGTFGGAALDPRGDATARIIGIPLDGTNDTQVVPDSDRGALDGDPVYDHAVGPMQFIPQTWARFASDGNGDAVATPFNLYDAALATARYLCRAAGGLDADPGLRAAYFSYNHSEPYVDLVLAFAHRYAAALDLSRPAD